MNYEELMRLKMEQISYPMELPNEADTPQFSDRKSEPDNLQSKFLEIEDQIQTLSQEKKIKVNWDILSDLVTEQPYTINDVDQLFTRKLRLVLNIQQFWQFLLTLAYDEFTFCKKNEIPFDKFRRVLGMIFDSVQDLNQDVISQIEQELDYRSYAHFNRILFQEGIPSFEKWIRIIRQSIQDSQSNYGGNIFRIVNETLRERQFDSFSNMPVDQNSSKFCSLKGNERSEKLYKHAQMLQEKKKTFHLVKVKEELDKAQQQKNYCNKSQNVQTSQVFERLYKIPQPVILNKEEELDSECTFNPKINSEIKQSEVKVEKIPGFNSQMKRVQKAQQEKEYKQNFYEIQQAKLQGLNSEGQNRVFIISTSNK
ncbi:hypothetical protein pb186bvf_018851 [Paramecium bursaria]